MRSFIPLLQRVPLLLTLLAGGYLIAVSDFVGGYLVMALTALCWWVAENVSLQFVVERLSYARAQMRALPSALTLILAIGFAGAGIALYLDRLIAM